MVHFTVTRVAALSMMRSFKKQQKQDTAHTSVSLSPLYSLIFLTCPFLEQGNVNSDFRWLATATFCSQSLSLCEKEEHRTQHGDTHKEYMTSGG